MNMDGLLNWIIIIGGSFIGAFALYFIIAMTKSHRLRVRDGLKENALIKDYWVFEKKQKDTGILFWVDVWGFGKNGFRIIRPPSQVIEIGPKGKMMAECYIISEDQHVWIKDNGIKIQATEDKATGNISYQILDNVITGNVKSIGKDGKEVEHPKTEYQIVDTFKPFTSTQREALVNQYRKSAELKNKGWTTDKIMNLAGIGVLLITVVMLMIFWGDLAQPILDMDGRLTAREQRLYQMEKQLCQEIKGETQQNIPEQKQNLLVEYGLAPPKK